MTLVGREGVKNEIRLLHHLFLSAAGGTNTPGLTLESSKLDGGWVLKHCSEESWQLIRNTLVFFTHKREMHASRPEISGFLVFRAAGYLHKPLEGWELLCREEHSLRSK